MQTALSIYLTTLLLPLACALLTSGPHVFFRYTRALPIVRSTRLASSSADYNQQENKSQNDELLMDKYQDEDFIRRSKHWIVFVDDGEAIRLAVGDYLYESGYQVTACADADAMLELCHETQSDGELTKIPDVILCDIRMPGGKDGLQLLKIIRSDSRLERVPVIMLTAKALTQDRIAGYKAGADGYLPKPFNPEELLAMVDNSIRRRQEMIGQNGKLVDLKSQMNDIKQILKKNGATVVKATNVYLSPAEREVLQLLCKGYTNAEIADARGVSVNGVSRTISKIYKESQTRTRTELVRWAIQTGYVSARE